MSSPGEMIKYFRKRYHYTQQELAEKVGLSRSALSLYELGAREPDFETMEAISDFFNVSMDVMMGRKEPAEGELTLTQQEIMRLVSDMSEEKAQNLLRFLKGL